MLTAILLASIFNIGCAHYSKDCPEPKRLPDEWLECNDHRSDSERYSFLSSGELGKSPSFESSSA